MVESGRKSADETVRSTTDPEKPLGMSGVGWRGCGCSACRGERRRYLDRPDLDSIQTTLSGSHRGIADGGHPFDEENLQTLCKYCHREKTSEENTTSEPQRSEVTLEEYIES